MSHKSEAYASKLQLATNQVPLIKLDTYKGYYLHGKKDKQAEYLLFLFKNNAEHGAIVKGKARYLSGKKIKATNENALVTKFLSRANPKESWYELSKKLNLDKILYGGYYLKVLTNALGTPIQWFHVDFAKIKVNKDQCSFTFCEDFNDNTEPKYDIPKYKEGLVGTFIYQYKTYNPSSSKTQGIYPEPEYLAGTLDIDTDIRITTFYNNLVRNNFSAGNIITIYDGTLEPEAKKEIKKGLKGDYNGEDNAGNTVVVFGKKDNKSTEVLPLNSNNLDKQYQEVRSTNKEKIVGAHNVPAPLFKIYINDKTLFTRTEYREMHELFINEYAEIEQVPLKTDLKRWCFLNNGQDSDFEIEQVDLIGLDLTEPNVSKYFTANEIRESLGHGPVANGDTSATATPAVQAANEHLKKLSGREYQSLMRIVRNYNNQKLTKDQALLMIKQGYGLSDDEALIFLGEAEKDLQVEIKQSADRSKKFLELVELYAHDISNDEVLDIEFIGHDIKMDKDFQSNGMSKSEVRNAILDQLKGNPFLKEQEIADILKVDLDTVRSTLAWLSDKKLVEAGQGSFQPTEKAMNKETSDLSTEIYTEYTYALRDDVSGPVLLPTSRDFCRKMVQLTKTKALSFEAIDKINNEFGENAFDFRGGFYNDGTTTTPWCRHIWLGTTKIRRVKK